MSSSAHSLDPRKWRQVAIITVVAVGVFVAFRWLPTGTNLNHMDFRVTATNSIDFCDPLNPQFIPVVAVASPVTMTVAGENAAAAGREYSGSVVLRTASGKPIGPVDLLVSHTRLLHLMVVDPSLSDYQHVHPEPSRTPGEWHFAFTPRKAGDYRIFADFTPAATGRSLYANTDLKVLGQGEAGPSVSSLTKSWTADQDGYHFELRPASLPVRAGKTADLKFRISADARGSVPMEPVMGAYAHLVAFDAARSGFAHLHPMETDLAQRPDSHHPELNFKITIPSAGTYVIWAQLNLGGRETYVPFWFDVAP